MGLGELLKKTRIDRKLSIRGLSKISGVSFSYISQLESKTRGSTAGPSLEIAKKLANALDIPISEIVKYTGNSLEQNEIRETPSLSPANQEIIKKLTYKLESSDSDTCEKIRTIISSLLDSF